MSEYGFDCGIISADSFNVNSYLDNLEHSTRHDAIYPTGLDRDLAVALQELACLININSRQS